MDKAQKETLKKFVRMVAFAALSGAATAALDFIGGLPKEQQTYYFVAVYTIIELIDRYSHVQGKETKVHAPGQSFGLLSRAVGLNI